MSEMVNGQSKFSLDRAAGVGILLSDRAMVKYMAHDSPCERVAWVRVRLESPVVPQFYVVPYFPHDSRENPFFLNALEKVIEVLK